MYPIIAFLSHTCRNDVVHNQDSLAFLDAVALHLEEILSILFLVGCGVGRSRKLALLAYWYEGTI